MSSSRAPVLSVRGLSASWGGRPVFRDLSFTLGERELVVLMGPNGAGKTTLLRVLTGLERPVAGSIELDGRSIDDLPTHRRRIGLLFQDPALFPRRTVFENLAYGLQLSHKPSQEIEKQVTLIAGLLRLDRLLDRYGHELSGGERQRVALGRTVAPRPRVVLLDEPFASIDVEIKAELRSEFRRVLATLGISAIHVTHDREEGLFLGDRVMILYDGKLKQTGSPEEVFRHPETGEVARFLGYNVFRFNGTWIAVDPHDIAFSGEHPGSMLAQVDSVGFVGDGRLVGLRTEDGSRIEARSAVDGSPLAIGDRVKISWNRSVPVGVGTTAGPTELRSPSTDR